MGMTVVPEILYADWLAGRPASAPHRRRCPAGHSRNFEGKQGDLGVAPTKCR
jgi:hypothetical protein